jgi:hypothetical protein
VWQLIVCGQALSHCVNFTFCDILDTWPEAERARLVLLTDGASSATRAALLCVVCYVVRSGVAGCRLPAARRRLSQ